MEIDNEVFINCSYIPVEIFALADFNVNRPWPSEISSEGQDFLPPDLCPYCRSFLASIWKEKGLKVIVNSCDGMRRVYDLVEESSFFLEVPHKSGEVGESFFYNRLKELLLELDIEPADPAFESELKEIIVYNNQLRERLCQIRDNLIKGNKSFSRLLEGIKYYYRQNSEALEKIIKKTESVNRDNNKSRKSVLVCSSNFLDISIIKLIERTGLSIVGLDSCFGERTFDFRINNNREPLRALAEGYLKKSACPRSMDPEKRLTEIKNIVNERTVEGIIYFTPKFCDQASYDFKMLKEQFRDISLPLLLIEGEYQAGKTGQIATRIAAFKESLGLG